MFGIGPPPGWDPPGKAIRYGGLEYYGEDELHLEIPRPSIHSSSTPALTASVYDNRYLQLKDVVSGPSYVLNTTLALLILLYVLGPKVYVLEALQEHMWKAFRSFWRAQKGVESTCRLRCYV